MIFFFKDPATTEIYTLSLHDALPIYSTGSGEDDVHDRVRGEHGEDDLTGPDHDAVCERRGVLHHVESITDRVPSDREGDRRGPQGGGGGPCVLAVDGPHCEDGDRREVRRVAVRVGGVAHPKRA